MRFPPSRRIWTLFGERAPGFRIVRTQTNGFWRVQLELDLRENDFDAISGPPGFGGSDDMQQFSQMINVIRDIDLGG